MSVPKGAPPSRRAYLDHAAGSPLRPEAFEAMLPFLTGTFGNASGVHAESRAARRAVDEAREHIAELLGVLADEVYFTSGGTESNNLAIGGIASADGDALVVSSLEHHSVLEPARARKGLFAPVLGDGRVDLDGLETLIGPHTRLVSVMAVNNETGVIQPIEQVALLVRLHSPFAILHCDAVQAVPWVEIGPITQLCGLVSLSAHKFGGPKGTGVLVVRRAARPFVNPILLGGSQERDLRAGTENVAGAVATAVALEYAEKEREATRRRVQALRDDFYAELAAAKLDVIEPAPRALRIAANAQLRLPGIDNEELLMLLDRSGVAASAASACASGALEPSHVLLAMGYSPAEARETVRLSLGETTTKAEMSFAAQALIASAERLLEGPRKGEGS